MSNSFVTPCIVAQQAPLSMGFPRQEYWSALQFPSPGGLFNTGIEPVSPTLAGRFFTAEPPGKPYCFQKTTDVSLGPDRDRIEIEYGTSNDHAFRTAIRIWDCSGLPYPRITIYCKMYLYIVYFGSSTGRTGHEQVVWASSLDSMSLTTVTRVSFHKFISVTHVSSYNLLMGEENSLAWFKDESAFYVEVCWKHIATAKHGVSGVNVQNSGKESIQMLVHCCGNVNWYSHYEKYYSYSSKN